MAVAARVLIFLPGDVSQIGLWQSHGPEGSWCMVDVPRTVRGQSAARDNRVLQAVNSLLTQTNLPLSHVTHIGVMRGPASYTELRLFVTTANTLAWAHGVPLFSFDPTTDIPSEIPHLMTRAKVNHPVEPVYPPLAGA